MYGLKNKLKNMLWKGDEHCAGDNHIPSMQQSSLTLRMDRYLAFALGS
jgi:hypothetical protein